MNKQYSISSFLLIVFLCISNACLWAQEETSDDTNGVKRLILNNGMKIVLKQTPFDPDEVLINLQAQGGYAALPQNQQAAAMLAPQMVLESNFTRGVSNFLSCEEIDFDVEIMPLSRGIQGYTTLAELDELLAVIRKLFIAQEISNEGYNRVITYNKERLMQKQYDFEEEFQRNFYSLNHSNVLWKQTVELTDLEAMDNHKCQMLYSHFFSNPQDFTVVMVGNFNLNTIQAQLEKSLGTISAKTSKLPTEQAILSKKLTEDREKEILGVGEKTSLVRLTYHWDSALSYEDMLTFKFINHILHHRLQALFKKTFNQDFGVEILHQLANYPHLNNSWLIIQFRCDYNTVLPLRKILAQEFARIHKEGISNSEIAEIKHKLNEEDEFWLRDNQYWLSTLSDFIIWEWPISKYTGSHKEFVNITSEKVNRLLKKLAESHHTMIYSKPTLNLLHN